jgi:hypothetical protein
MGMHEFAEVPNGGLVRALWTLVGEAFGEEESKVQVWGLERVVSTVEGKLFDNGHKREE